MNIPKQLEGDHPVVGGKGCGSLTHPLLSPTDSPLFDSEGANVAFPVLTGCYFNPLADNKLPGKFVLLVQGVCQVSQQHLLGACCIHRWECPGAFSQVAPQRGLARASSIAFSPHTQCGMKQGTQRPTQDCCGSLLYLGTRTWELGVVAPMISHFGFSALCPCFSV